jgi:hypothetical protein
MRMDLRLVAGRLDAREGDVKAGGGDCEPAVGTPATLVVQIAVHEPSAATGNVVSKPPAAIFAAIAGAAAGPAQTPTLKNV